MEKSYSNVVCPGCACLCDDVSVTFDDSKLVQFTPACPLGESWFQRHSGAAAEQAQLNPFQVQGETSSYDAAIEKAVEILKVSEYPLIYGLSRSSSPGQRAAVELGEFLGGVVDTTASLCHGPSIMALQEMGEVTCTLGEVRNRADLVIFWGCNPAESHPRHAGRYSVSPEGRLLPGGRNDRTVIMLGNAEKIGDWRLDDDGTEPDLKIPIPPGKDFEALSLLQSMLRDPSMLEDDQYDSGLRELLRRALDCKYGIVFFGVGLAETGAWADTPRTGTGHVNVSTLLHWVAEMNTHSRFTARRMRLQGDVSGADNILLWQTTYPFAVDFSRGFPRYNPGEFTAEELLNRQEVDAALIVGAETIPFLTAEARRHLNEIPTVLLDYPGAAATFSPMVHLTTAVYGLNAAGTSYRMDNVPMRLSPLVDSSLKTDESVLRDVLSRLIQNG